VVIRCKLFRRNLRTYGELRKSEEKAVVPSRCCIEILEPGMAKEIQKGKKLRISSDCFER
jgi:hypothetical protein